MTTDWLLIRRVAAELQGRLAGGRVTDVGLLDDGRFAVRFARGGTLAVDAFGSPPLVTLEDAEPSVAAEPGWLRAAGTALRGTRLRSVQGRTADRVLSLRFGGVSRFGVESGAELVLELVPRYGNVVVDRDGIVIAAAKQFSPAENEARTVQVGMRYEPPPLPQPRLDLEGFSAALRAARDVAERARALGAYLPELPRALATSVVTELSATAAEPEFAQRVESRSRAVLADATSEEAQARPVYVYRDASGALVAAHVVPLVQFAELREQRAAQLLDLLSEARAGALRAKSGDAVERRRNALLSRIAKRTAATDAESVAVKARIDDAAARDVLRRSGDALYTHAHEIAPGTASYVPPTDPALRIELDPQLDAKANAQRYYARYRKATDALPHLERRAAALRARHEALDVLAFEAERADAATLREVEADLDQLEGRRRSGAPLPAARPRAPLRLERPSGARIYVGRSPRENVEVTFRIARPDDLWFHARGIPGSHVVLQAPPGAAPNEADLDAAADLAAAHSKARHAGRVEVDYTERKYVRKQRDAGPGLVWYTNARTRVGRAG